jgi:hypothetical protein
VLSAAVYNEIILNFTGRFNIVPASFLYGSTKLFQIPVTGREGP